MFVGPHFHCHSATLHRGQFIHHDWNPANVTRILCDGFTDHRVRYVHEASIDSVGVYIYRTQPRDADSVDIIVAVSLNVTYLAR